MFENRSFPATGKWARHLTRLAAVSKIPIDAQLVALARTYSFDADALPGQLGFSKREYDALQYVLDWEGRAVILDNQQTSFAIHVAVLSAILLGSKSIIVFGPTSGQLKDWEKVIKQLAPNDLILQQNVSRTGVNYDNLTRNDPHSVERKWIIAAGSSMERVEMISEFNTDHLIIIRSKTGGHTSSDACMGLCGEILRSTFIFKTTDFWTNPDEYESQIATGNVTTIAREFLHTSKSMSLIPQLFKVSQSLNQYFRKHGMRYNVVDLLRASGICFDLVLEEASTRYQNVLSAAMLVGVGEHSNRRIEIINQYKSRQTDLEVGLNLKLSEIIDRAVNGDVGMQVNLEKLKTQGWAKLKAQAIYQHIRGTSKDVMRKTIVVAKHPDIRKYIQLSLNAIEIGEDTSPVERDRKYANFVYPNDAYSSFEHLPAGFSPRASVMAITSDIAALDPRVFESVEDVVFAEYEYSVEQIGDFLELSKLFGFTAIFGTMRGTFEDELADRLLTPHR